VKSEQSVKLRILDYVFYVFLNGASIKRKKSRFLDFQKKRKIRMLELCPKESNNWHTNYLCIAQF